MSRRGLGEAGRGDRSGGGGVGEDLDLIWLDDGAYHPREREQERPAVPPARVARLQLVDVRVAVASQVPSRDARARFVLRGPRQLRGDSPPRSRVAGVHRAVSRRELRFGVLHRGPRGCLARGRERAPRDVRVREPRASHER